MQLELYLLLDLGDRLMRALKQIIATILVIIASTSNTIAHHSFASVFDENVPVDFVGNVTKIEWLNPHVWFYINVENDDGTIDNWAFEMGSPNGLVRLGWKRKNLRPGQLVTIDGYRAKNGSAMASIV